MFRKVLIAGLIVVVSSVMLLFIAYSVCRIDVPYGNIAVLTHKTGKDISNDDLVAPDGTYKGVMLNLLTEGRFFYNPYEWDWGVYPMIEIPSGKMGVRIRQYGKNLPYGQFLSQKPDQKGIISEVLLPARYPINAVIKGQENGRSKKDYVEMIELHDPIIISAGFRGVVTNLAGPFAADPNVYLVEKGFRGVQKETLTEGTYYLNPYEYRVNIVDCRSQRFNLAEEFDMGFPSRDGFWISLDAIIEYKVKPEKASEVFVIYNETNSKDKPNETSIHDELVKKIIMPTARSFCRVHGSNRSGREFIGGDTRIAFQKKFQEELKKNCDPQGVEIVQALVTKIVPPQAIARPVQEREVSRQNLAKFVEQKAQYIEEAKLAIEKAMINQKQEIVKSNQKVVQSVTEANQRQKVEVTQAEQAKSVAQRGLEAVKDRAAAVTSRKKAEASIIDLQNMSEAAGWKRAVEAFGGDGEAFARYVLYLKLAPAFQSILANSHDSSLMDVFNNFKNAPRKTAPTTPPTTEKK
jgi:hypothetical protein